MRRVGDPVRRAEHEVQPAAEDRREDEGLTRVLLACPGPSISLVEWHLVTATVAAISSGIKCVPKGVARLWFFLDPPTENHFGAPGVAALNDPTVRKISKGVFRERRPWIINCDLEASERPYSLPMAVNWLCRRGSRELLFAGVDCSGVYAHNRTLNDDQRAHMERVGTTVLGMLRDAMNRYPATRFVSLSPESPISEFMEVGWVQTR